MKIAIVCYPVKGGSGVVASELGIGLSRRGCEVHFFSYELPFRLGNYESNFFFHEVDISQYPLFKYPPYTITLAAKLVDESLNHNFDIINAHYAIPHAAAAYLARQTIGDNPPKIITTLHGTDITLIGQDKSFFSITKFTMEVSDGLTTVSKYLQEKTRESFGITKPIRVIPNFVDTELFSPEGADCARNRLADPDQKILMHMSNFRPVKNATDVIRIFEKITRKMKARLFMVGDGPDAGNAKSLARELGVDKNVMFLGNQDRVHNILPLADLFILPSASEAFGLAALEALSCGVPVIGTIVGGLPEIVIDDFDGYLYPIGDVDSMADKALELLEDDDKRKVLSSNARQMCIEKYQFDNIIDRYLEYYEEIRNG